MMRRGVNPFACKCGTCDECVIECETTYLSELEAALWMRANGDVTRYLNLMSNWMDLFNEQKGFIP